MAKTLVEKYSPWIWKGEPFDHNSIQEDWEGFVYLIKLIHPVSKDVFYYVGKKNFATNAKTKLSKKEMPTDKRLKTYKRVRRFNYINYMSSSEGVVAKINEGFEPERIILQICKTKGALTYHEVRWMMKFRALERKDFLNDNVLGSFYKKHFYA
jgi:hypothetical protein